MFFSAFFLGLVGSLHCVSMCGPLALLMPKSKTNVRFISGRIIYNFGRITTYVLLGILIGLLGEQVSYFSSQKWLSIGLGFAILIGLFFYRKFNSSKTFFRINSLINNKVAKLLNRTNGNKFYLAQFSFGLVNGLLPCGMVYAALSGAFLQFQVWQGGVFMLLFGLGTLPLMLAASLGLGWLKNKFSLNFQQILPISYAFIAVWLIVRGINDFNHQINRTISDEVLTNCETTSTP